MAPGQGAAGRRGRPRDGEREEREQAILDTTRRVLIEQGYDGVTMQAIARAASCSKETLYSWFGNREGLFRALIERNADESAGRVQAALDRPADPRETLTGYAIGLLSLLTSPPSIALNRAAMSSPELAERLLASGRHRIGPLVERYLATIATTGELAIDDPAEVFELFYGLVVRDTQIRVLLGESPPDDDAITERATSAVTALYALLAP